MHNQSISFQHASHARTYTCTNTHKQKIEDGEVYLRMDLFYLFGLCRTVCCVAKESGAALLKRAASQMLLCLGFRKTAPVVTLSYTF